MPSGLPGQPKPQLPPPPALGLAARLFHRVGALVLFAVIWVIIGAACVANPWVDCYIDFPERHTSEEVSEDGGHALIMCESDRSSRP